MSTITLTVPALDDPANVAAYIEAARVEFENKLRDVLDATPGGYANDLHVSVAVFASHGTDTRTLALDALRDGARTFRARTCFGVEFVDPSNSMNSVTTIYVKPRRKAGAK